MVGFLKEQSVLTLQAAPKSAIARYSSTFRLAWAFGISLAICISNCSTNEPEKPKEPSFEDLDAADEADQDLEDLTIETAGKSELEFIHPGDHEPWTLKSLIMTANKPPEVDLIRCRNEIFAVSNETYNASGLLIAKRKIYADVNQNKIRFHWCFYFSMMIVDTKLQSDALGNTLRERLNGFHKEMKGLWILSSALDQAFQSKRYFSYLRSRYMDISKEYFARRLNPEQKPIGQVKAKKPAGEFEPLE